MIKVPNIQDVYQVSYLVNRGWKMDLYSWKWSKDGFSRKFFNDSHREDISTEFETEEAYWQQIASEE